MIDMLHLSNDLRGGRPRYDSHWLWGDIPFDIPPRLMRVTQRVDSRTLGALAMLVFENHIPAVS